MTISTMFRKTMKTTIWSSALALFVVAGVSFAAAPLRGETDPSPARAAVDETVEAVLAVLRQNELPVAERQQQIEAIAIERFDFVTMSKLVLKRDWRRFDKDQKQQFVDAFRDHLAASYGTRIERYEQEAVSMLGERVEPGGDVTVRTKIEGGAADGIEIQYRMRERKGRWRVIDVVIEGVSLVANFRSQFSEVLSRGGPEELLRRLQEKNAEGAPTAAAS